MTNLYAQTGSNEVAYVSWNTEPGGGGSSQAPVSNDILDLNSQWGITFNNTSGFSAITFTGSNSESLSLTAGTISLALTLAGNLNVSNDYPGASQTVANGYSLDISELAVYNANGYGLIVEGTLTVYAGTGAITGLGTSIGENIMIGSSYSAAMNVLTSLDLSSQVGSIGGGVTGGTLTIGSGATLTLPAFNSTFASLTVDIQSGGTLTVGGNASDQIGETVSVSGILNLNAISYSSIVSGGSITVASGGECNVNTPTLYNVSGTLEVEDGGTLLMPYGYISSSGTLTLDANSDVSMFGVTMRPRAPATHSMAAYSGDLTPAFVLNFNVGAIAGGTLSTDNVLTTDPGGAGNYHAVAATNIRKSTPFGPGGSLSGLAYIPAAGDVQQGVNVDQTTGTFLVPPVDKVQINYPYGAGGSEFTGTLDASGGVPTGLDDVIERYITPQPGETTQEQVDRLHARWFSA
jgi:hypothetical protein